MDCEKAIIAAAQQAGWLVHGNGTARMQSGKMAAPIKGDPGFPDLVLMRPPVLYVVELKRKPNDVEPAQQKWLDGLKACGIDADVVWVPEEQEKLIELLTRRRPRPTPIAPH